MAPKNINTNDITVGVVGLGLMGSSIVISLLVAGHKVIALSPLPTEFSVSVTRIKTHLAHVKASGLLNKPESHYLAQLTITTNYTALQSCSLVLECVIEIDDVKKSVYQQIEKNTTSETVIASNTSAMPISQLQNHLHRPERFLGIHWAEPSYLTRFMEITCGEKTDLQYANWVVQLAHEWGKEPTLLKKDLRGFVTNRLMYAIYRESFSLIEQGVATFEDMDKAFRYDAGSWMTLMGIFRRMDFTGLADYPEIFKNIFPKLSNDQGVPEIMKKMMQLQARGTQSAQGLYQYTQDEAKKWDDAFACFNADIYKLASAYPLQNPVLTGKTESV